MLPAEQARLAALLASLYADDDEETLTFAAGEGEGEVTEARAAALESFLGALPKRVEYDTLAGGTAPAQTPRSDFVAPADATVDPASLTVHDRAAALAAERDIPYVEAARIAARGA